MEYRVGDQLQYKLINNFSYNQNPHRYVIFKIEKRKNCYWVRNLQNQEISQQSKENLELYFTFQGHTR